MLTLLLSCQERKRQYKDLVKELEHAFKEIRHLDKTLQKEIMQLDTETATPHVEGFIKDIDEKYDYPEVHEYLEEIRSSILNNLPLFLEKPGEGPAWMGISPSAKDDPRFLEYKVNVIVDNTVSLQLCSFFTDND